MYLPSTHLDSYFHTCPLPSSLKFLFPKASISLSVVKPCCIYIVVLLKQNQPLPLPSPPLDPVYSYLVSPPWVCSSTLPIQAKIPYSFKHGKKKNPPSPPTLPYPPFFYFLFYKEKRIFPFLVGFPYVLYMLMYRWVYNIYWYVSNMYIIYTYIYQKQKVSNTYV